MPGRNLILDFKFRFQLSLTSSVIFPTPPQFLLAPPAPPSQSVSPQTPSCYWLVPHYRARCPQQRLLNANAFMAARATQQGGDVKCAHRLKPQSQIAQCGNINAVPVSNK